MKTRLWMKVLSILVIVCFTGSGIVWAEPIPAGQATKVMPKSNGAISGAANNVAIRNDAETFTPSAQPQGANIAAAAVQGATTTDANNDGLPDGYPTIGPMTTRLKVWGFLQDYVLPPGADAQGSYANTVVWGAGAFVGADIFAPLTAAAQKALAKLGGNFVLKYGNKVTKFIASHLPKGKAPKPAPEQSPLLNTGELNGFIKELENIGYGGTIHPVEGPNMDGVDHIMQNLWVVRPIETPEGAPWGPFYWSRKPVKFKDIMSQGASNFGKNKYGASGVAATSALTGSKAKSAADAKTKAATEAKAKADAVAKAKAEAEAKAKAQKAAAKKAPTQKVTAGKRR